MSEALISNEVTQTQQLDPQSPLYFRYLMFISLATECEKWALSLKGNVQRELKMRLNLYLQAQSILMRHCKPNVNQDDMEEFGEIFSRILEKIYNTPKEKRLDLFAVMDQYVKGNIKIED